MMKISELARAVYRRDIRPSALGSSISSMFFGSLSVSIEADDDLECYTYMRKEGKAVVHIGLGFACLASGYNPNGHVKDALQMAKRLKTAMYAAAYHELGHLKKSDMTGEPYKAIPTQYTPFMPFIKKGTNVIEDPAMEREVRKSPYMKRIGLFFKWVNKNYFTKEAKSYKDDGSLDSFLNYLLLYLRVGPHLIASRNAIYDSLIPKGIEAKLREAYRERNATRRLKKQITFFEWVVDEVQPDTTKDAVGGFHERPVIIIVDPKTGKKGKLTPQPSDGEEEDSELPPVSVVEAKEAEDGDGTEKEGENPDADIIDMRKNRPEGSEEGETEVADTPDGGGEGEDEGSDTEDSPSKSHQAGTGEGPDERSGQADFDWELGDEDPVEVLAVQGLDSEYDPELENALRVEGETDKSSTAYLARDMYDVADADAAMNLYFQQTAKAASVTSGLAYSLTELKAETASTEIHWLSDGEELSFNDYLEDKMSGCPTHEIYVDTKKGREITDLAVYLLVDCSGSMEGEASQLAYTTSCTVMAACKEADVPTEISAFSSAWGEGGILVVKSFEDSPEEAIPRMGLLCSETGNVYDQIAPGLSLWGGTDCESALALALGRIRNYDEKANKLLFVITDGDTGSPETTGALVSQARQEGIVVIGIGIGTSLDNLRKCFAHCKVFSSQSLGQLPGYVAEEIRLAMASDEFEGY